MDESAFDVEDLERDLHEAGFDDDPVASKTRPRTLDADTSRPLSSSGAAGRHGRTITSPTPTKPSPASSAGKASRMKPPTIAPPANTPPANGGSSPTPTSRGSLSNTAPAGSIGMPVDEGLGMTSSSQSRARVLAQQREIQMKRRQQSMGAAGPMRLNNDSVSLSRGFNATAPADMGKAFTPAVKQFSAPRLVEEETYSSFGGGEGPRSTTPKQQSEFNYDRRRKLGGTGDLGEDDDYASSQGGMSPVPFANGVNTNMNIPAASGDGSESVQRRSVSNKADWREEPVARGPSYEDNWSASKRRGTAEPEDTSEWHDSSAREGSTRGPGRSGGDDWDEPVRRGSTASDHVKRSGGNRRSSQRDDDDSNSGRGGYHHRGGSSRSNNYDDNEREYGYGDPPRRDSRDYRRSDRDDDRERPEHRSEHRPEYNGRDRDDEGRGSSRNMNGNSSRGDNWREGEDSRRGSAQQDAHAQSQSKSNNMQAESKEKDRDDDTRAARQDEYAQEKAGEGHDSDSQHTPTPGTPRNTGKESAAAPVADAHMLDVMTTPPPRKAPVMALDVSDMRKFLTTPCPKAAGVVQCYIRRNKSGTNKLYPEYYVYMEDGDRFIMCSKKRTLKKTSNYLVSMKAGDLNRDGQNYLGKLRANFVGTEFQVFDSGSSPKFMASGAATSANAKNRLEMGVVTYTTNMLGPKGPRKMQVAIPSVDDEGKVSQWQDGKGDQMLPELKSHNLDKLCYLINKPPRWNDQVAAYVLNFMGRVTMASVKNFQLVTPENQDSIVLQFGRIAKDEFTMDFQWPISPFQAFAITLSSFDQKILID